MEADDRRTSNSLARYGWQTSVGVENWLFAEGYKFDFFQAVRLLEMMQAADQSPAADQKTSSRNGTRKRRVSPGEGADPTKEIVHFKSAVRLDFPTSDVAELRFPALDFLKLNRSNGDHAPGEMVADFKHQETPAEMTVNFLGLAGGLGALDIPTTESVLRQQSRNDQPFRDFLDIFNHRLVSLLYRIRKHHRVGLGVMTPGEDQMSRHLYSLIGLGTPNLQGRMQVRDRALLHYAGILAQSPRSMVGLERILSDYFGVEVKGRQFNGRWCELEETEWTRLGASGQNQRLGRDTVVVGTRIWDQAARFEIELGPLSLAQFVDFLPTNWSFGVLCDLIRFYVKDQFEFSIRLILNADEVPGTELKSPHSELSWTSWLGAGEHKVGGQKGPQRAPENPYITISPESLRAESEGIKSRILQKLPRGKQSELLRLMEKKNFERSDIVMAQGKPGKRMFVILEGKVQISRRENGKERVIGVLGPGDSFGELALLMQKLYGETALALSKCEIAWISRQELDEFKDKNPILGRTIDAYCKRSDRGQKNQFAIAKGRG